jgi:hypothetical protein
MKLMLITAFLPISHLDNVYMNLPSPKIEGYTTLLFNLTHKTILQNLHDQYANSQDHSPIPHEHYANYVPDN